MPTKHRPSWWKKIFLALAIAVLLAALYFFVYDLARRLGGQSAAAPVGSEERPSATSPVGDYSHLPQSDGKVAIVTPVPEPDLPIPPGPAIPPPVVPTLPGPVPADAADLPSAILKPSEADMNVGSSSSLSFGSFQESFVSAANIDTDQTSLYRDDRVGAAFFAPDYSWEAATPELINLFRKSFSSLRFNGFEGTHDDKRCLENDCLELQGLNLFYNGQSLSRPASLRGADVAAVSLGGLSRRWLVGFSIREAGAYRGLVFYFDGKDFTPLALPTEAVSASVGLFGFGGEETDFLIAYGSDRPVAYRVRGAQVQDMSRWFSIRTIIEGFKPEIVRTVRDGDVTWYIYSATAGRPRLLKLWQNGTTEIVGEALFDLFGSDILTAGFRLVSNQDDSIILIAMMNGSSSESWKVFSDRGFHNGNAAVLVTKPIAHDGVSSPIVMQKIASIQLVLDPASQKTANIVFSEDGLSWRPLPAVPDQEFKTRRIANYRLKITFPALSNRFRSPFLDSFLFNYYAKKFSS